MAGSVLCVAELRRGSLIPTAFELITAGRKLCKGGGGTLSVAVIGGPGKASAAAAQVAGRGADRVLVAEHARLDQFTDEAFALAVRGLVEKEKPSAVLFPASAMGRSLAARTAVLCHGSLVSDVTDIDSDAQGRLAAVRPCCGGAVLAGVAALRGPAVATVRPMAFARSEPSGKTAPVESVPVGIDEAGLKTKFAGFTPEQSKEIDLSSAEKIVSGGRGLGNPKGFDLIHELAQTLGAAVGASRAVVDSGWIPYRHQVGLTGRAVRPRLYVACGISGQVQHLAGMSSADVIVAINSDPDCPMMKLANYAVQGDLHQIIPAVIAEIKKQRG